MTYRTTHQRKFRYTSKGGDGGAPGHSLPIGKALPLSAKAPATTAKSAALPKSRDGGEGGGGGGGGGGRGGGGSGSRLESRISEAPWRSGRK